ncbi:MAG: hypothetical protein FWD77_03370 [Betaproteobacteria bacterium]|nr:hypothetical protein [Betaproteobacteria bacterium]
MLASAADAQQRNSPDAAENSQASEQGAGDGLFANWEIMEEALPHEVYRLNFKAAYLRRGGDGEPLELLKRRARQLQLEKGATGYRILDYSESIESTLSFFFARRTATGAFVLQFSPWILEENPGTNSLK